MLTAPHDLLFEGLGKIHGAAAFMDVDVLPDGRYLVTDPGSISRHAKNGELDLSFGNRGIVRYELIGDVQFQESVIQSNGKIVVKENRDYSGDSLFRLNPDGTLDESFGVQGRVEIPKMYWDLLLMPNDDIVVSSLEHGFSLVRLKKDGTFDNTFGENGVLPVTHPNYGEFHSESMAGQDNPFRIRISTGAVGTILVQATAPISGQDVPVLLRYAADGALDQSFGTYGATEIPFRGQMAVDDAGRILLARSVRANDWELEMERLLPDGSADISFAPKVPGLTQFDSDVPRLDEITDPRVLFRLHTDPGGGFMILGTRSAGDYLNLHRFGADGEFDWEFSQRVSAFGNRNGPGGWLLHYPTTLDASGNVYVFGGHGNIIKISRGEATELKQPEVAYRIAATDLQGNPLQTVTVGQPFQLNVFVKDLRDAPQGVFAAYVDVSIASGDVTRLTDIVFGEQFPNGQSADYYLTNYFDEVGGFGGLNSTAPGEQLLFSTTLRADSLDTVTIYLNPADESPVHDVLLVGRAGERVRARDTVFGALELSPVPVQWLNANNKYDVDGDGKGTVLDALAVINDINASGARLLEQHNPGNKFLDVNDDEYVSAADVLEIIDMLNSLTAPTPATGGLDTDFGIDGRTELLFPGYGMLFQYATAIQPDQKVLVAHSRGGLTSEIVRLLPDGALDEGFGDGGRIGVDFSPLEDLIHAIVIDGSNRILVSGGMDWREGTSFVARYAPDGALDTTFGERGKVTFEVGPYSSGHKLRLLDDGSILAVATGTEPDFGASRTLIKLDLDGGWDTTFGDGGRVTLPPTFSVTDLAVQQDGRVILVGENRDSSARLTLLRYLPDGQLDTSFGEAGFSVTSFSTNIWRPPANMEVGPEGHIFVADTFDSDYVAVARFETNGQLDISYGEQGVFRGPPPPNYDPGGRENDMVVAENGEVFLTGPQTWGRRGHAGQIFRISPGGRAFANVEVGPKLNPESLVQQSDGSLIVVGVAYPAPNESGESSTYVKRFEIDEPTEGENQVSGG